MRWLCFILMTVVLLTTCNTNSPKQLEDASKLEELEDEEVLFSTYGIPELLEYDDTIAYVTALRNYVAATADRGLMPNPAIDTFYQFPLSNFPVSYYLDIFEGNAGTTTCGLSSYIYVSLLDQQGVTAYTYNFGYPNTAYTHVVSLVDVEGKLLVMDPYFNYTITDKKGELLDFNNILTLLQKGEERKLQVASDTVYADFHLDLEAMKEIPKDKLHTNCALDIDTLKKDYHLAEGQTICYDCPVLDCYSVSDQFEQHMTEETDADKFLEAYLLKINEINGAQNADDLNARIDDVLN